MVLKGLESGLEDIEIGGRIQTIQIPLKLATILTRIQETLFLAILAVARMVIWTTRNKGLYDDTNFSHRDLVLYFPHQNQMR